MSIDWANQLSSLAPAETESRIGPQSIDISSYRVRFSDNIPMPILSNRLFFIRLRWRQIQTIQYRLSFFRPHKT